MNTEQLRNLLLVSTDKINEKQKKNTEIWAVWGYHHHHRHLQYGIVIKYFDKIHLLDRLLLYKNQAFVGIL